MTRKLLLGLMLLGCASEDGEEPPVECDRDDRRGTYLIEYAERDGNCGPIPDQVQRLDATSITGDPACSLTEGDRWSRNDCRIERSYVCDFDGDTYWYTGFTDSNASGSKITGLLQVTVESNRPCSSTYDVEMTRQ